METFFALLALCAGNSPVTGEFTPQRLVTRSFDIFFDLCLNKRLSKQSRRRWFETPSCSSWRHCNEPMKSWSISRVNRYVPFILSLCCLVCIHGIGQLRNDVTHRYMTWKRSMSTGRISYIHPAIKTIYSKKLKPQNNTKYQILTLAFNTWRKYESSCSVQGRKRTADMSWRTCGVG